MLDRKLLRDLWRFRGLLLAIVAIIGIGVGCFVSLLSCHANLERSRNSYYARCRFADFWIVLRKAPVGELSALETIAEIAAYRPRIAEEVRVDLPDEPRPVGGKVLSLPDSPTQVINDIILKQGTYFTGQRREEVIVNESFARKRNLRPGDRLHLILNQRRQELVIVGTAISAEFVYLIGPGSLIPEPENYGVFYVTQSFAEEAFDFQGACNEIVGLLDPRVRERPTAVLEHIERVLESHGVLATIARSQQQSHSFLDNEMSQLRTTARFLPTMFLAVAALMLNVLMLRLTEQQRTLMGTLKALGYGNRELFGHFLKFGMLVAVVGGIVGDAIGFAFAGLMIRMYRQFYEFPDLANRVQIEMCAAGIGISVVFALFGTARAVHLVTRLRPADAMRPKPPADSRAILLERFPGLWQSLGFRWHMVLRGLIRHPLRTLAGLFAAAMGCAIMLATLCSRDIIDHMLDFQFQKVLVCDYELTLKEPADANALLEARRLPGVDLAEPVFVVGCELVHGRYRKKTAITGILPDARLNIPRDAQGRRVDLPSTGLLMSRALADILHVQPPDHVTLIPVRGRRDPIRVPVTRIVDNYLGLVTFADFDYLNRLVDERSAVSSLQLRADPRRDAKIALQWALKELPAVQSISPIQDRKQTLIDTIAKARGVMDGIMIGFAGGLLLASIVNAALISLAERQREVATFRVLGYSAREIGGIFLRETLLVNTLGALVGLPIGALLCHGLISASETELFRFPFTIRASSFVWAMVWSIFFTLAAHALVQRAISRLDWKEAINQRE